MAAEFRKADLYMSIKSMIKKMIYKEKSDSETYIKHLRSKGMKIGKHLLIPELHSIVIDETRPWLIEIGDDVVITAGTTILTHGYDLTVLRKYYGELYGSSGKVVIGNNVFIGTRTTILKGITIGNNVIIGANSLVNKSVPDNCVVAGNPARVIMTLDEYREKRKSEYVDEAKELAKEYYKTYGKKPEIEKFHEFFPIMVERDKTDISKFRSFRIESFAKKYFETEPIYNGLDEFLDDCDLM